MEGQNKQSNFKRKHNNEKIYRYSAIYALALSFALNTSSCSDFLQVEPTGSLTEEQVFEKQIMQNLQFLDCIRVIGAVKKGVMD